MSKKLVSFLLVMIMIVSCLVGCGSSKEQESASGNQESESSSEEKTDSKENAEESKKELSVVRVLCVGEPGPYHNAEDFWKYPSTEYLAEQLAERGIVLEYETVPLESYAEVIRTRMASGVDLPDYISNASGVGQTEIIEWGRNGLVADIADLMEQYDEDGSVKAFYEKEAPGLWGMNSTETGELYFVSYMYPVGGRTVIDKATGESYVRLNPRGLSIRRDWVDAIGEEWKDVYTPEELRDLFVKFREKDANGNGAADEVVHLEIEGFNNGIAKAFGMTDRLIAGYFNNENVVFSNFQHENFAAYVKFMQSLVEAGVYDTAALTTGREEMISQNRVSAAHYYCATEFEVDLPETSPEDEYLYYPVYIDLDGDITNGFNYTADGDEPTAYTQFFVPEGAKNKEGAAILIDYIFSDEYAVLNQFGLEGKGYELDENGNYVKLKNEEDPNQTLAPGDVGCEWYLGCVWNLPKLSETHLSSKGQTHAYMKAKEDWVLDFHLNTRQYLENYEWRTQNLAIESEEEAAVLNEISPVLETYCQELITDLVLGRKSLDDMPTYLEELEELGLQDYIDIMQARRDRVVGQ